MTGVFLDNAEVLKLQRKPGRPKRAKRAKSMLKRITVNLDAHLYVMLENIADNEGEPSSRVLNKILQVFHDTVYNEAKQ